MSATPPAPPTPAETVRKVCSPAIARRTLSETRRAIENVCEEILAALKANQ